MRDITLLSRSGNPDVTEFSVIGDARHADAAAYLVALVIRSG
jgi:hypothetical protein